MSKTLIISVVSRNWLALWVSRDKHTCSGNRCFHPIFSVFDWEPIILYLFSSLTVQHRPKARSLNKGSYNSDTGVVYVADTAWEVDIYRKTRFFSIMLLLWATFLLLSCTCGSCTTMDCTAHSIVLVSDYTIGIILMSRIDPHQEWLCSRLTIRSCNKNWTLYWVKQLVKVRGCSILISMSAWSKGATKGWRVVKTIGHGQGL